MSSLFRLVSQPPEWHLDWDALRQECPWLRPLAGCPQDPDYHGEGDAWVHTRLVCERLVASAGWRASVDEARQVLSAAALLHDVAKPDCTRLEPSGRVSARGHARRGAIMARRILWRLGTPIRLREQVAALVRFHQTPFQFLERPDPRRVAITSSQAARCDHLAILAEADARGRVCRDQQQMLGSVALFADYCRELGCLEAPYPFPSDHSRFLYFQREGRDPDYLAYDDCRLERR